MSPNLSCHQQNRLLYTQDDTCDPRGKHKAKTYNEHTNENKEESKQH